MTKTIALALTLALPVLGACAASPDDSMREAKKANEAQTLPMAEGTADFLVAMTDARMMDTAEGRLAFEQGTTEAIRDCGRLMVEEQKVLADELTSIAADADVTLPTTLSDEKSSVLEDLSELRGEQFDRELIETIAIDHECDLEAFAGAREMNYAPVREFAGTCTPMIERHLTLIENIERGRSGAS